ncbi:MAG: HD domain-containing protein, partial [Lachnospiraceae bacterium]|nr:HD domain-containing protein [Lachnospiraceae bacterium]
LIYLVIVQRMELYHVSDMAIESMARSGDTGFISLDFQYHYLGSNEAARHILPVLEEIAVDNTIIGVDGLEDNLLNWLAWFKDNENTGAKYYSVTPAKEENKDSGETEKADETVEKPDTEEEKPALTEEIYRVQVRYLHDGTKKCGYQIILTNDTQNQKYIRLLTQYRAQLQDEVAMKTASIIRMHDNLIMSMAAMVESRDNSTGGHIKRTSVCVRILIDEILKLGTPVLTEEFCRNIIKAAPMHDLGKIAVDDAILRKPGRFEPEEYEKMKAHAAEGARIVHEILKDTDDKAFHHLAENVAHYHHERWDGSGYPDGLKGEEIPLEARIMAIADVYDALVSKRVYKESMSFEEADRIISEGMGTHFDPQLRECYEKARPRLEQFYRKESLEEEEKARQEARDRTEAEMKEEKKGSEGSRTGQVGTVNE